MKLYYKPGACSLATHIILREVGANFDLEKVDTRQGFTSTGAIFARINPKGCVPALSLASGEILTEGVAILQFLADQYPQFHLAPPHATLERARLQEYLNFTASELHKAFKPFFSESVGVEENKQAIKNVGEILDYLEGLFSDGREFLLGEVFTVSDAYLFVVCNWSAVVGIKLSRWPKLEAFIQRISQRSSVKDAMSAEGLL